MHVAHRITGYSRTSDALVEQHPVPPQMLEMVKGIAQVRSDDPEAVWSYPLSDREARHLAQIMSLVLDTGQNEYFLESIASAESAPQAEHRREAV